jgi:phosphopantetheinyl transferase
MPALWSTLSAEEVERANRYGTDALRDRYVAGRAALRETLAQRLGIARRTSSSGAGRAGARCWSRRDSSTSTSRTRAASR